MITYIYDLSIVACDTFTIQLNKTLEALIRTTTK